MRISYSLGSVLTIDQLLRCSKLASSYKPEMLWIPETWGMNNFVILGALTNITNKIKLGSSITNVYSRSPALIAMSTATIDVLSHGRMILGLGTSSHQIIKNFHGYEFKQHLIRTKEYIEIIKLILTGKKINYNGELFKLKNFKLLISTYQRKIPIYLAAVNNKMIQLGIETADGFIFYLRPINELKKTIKKIKMKKQLEITCQIITCMSNDEDEAIISAKKSLAFYISVGTIYRNFLIENGYSCEINNIFSEYLKSGFKYNYKFVTKRMLDDLTIYGTPNTCTKKLKKFMQTGLDLPIIQFNPIGDFYESFNLLLKTFSSI